MPSPSVAELIQQIYTTIPTDEEQVLVKSIQEKLAPASDIGGKDLYLSLRKRFEENELDSTSGWHTVREKAREELPTVLPNFLVALLTYASPFIRSLPAGHSKGHFLRDAIHLIGILNDPLYKEQKIDEVELFVGIISAMFHDIGNSLVERFDDVHRMGAHAEVGAVLMGYLLEKQLPDAPHLILLIQYSIAAHTNYLTERTVETKEGHLIGTTKPYDAKIGKHDEKRSLTITRQSDRRDMSNFTFIIRNLIVNINPIKEFSNNEFVSVVDAETNFKTKYGLHPKDYWLTTSETKHTMWTHLHTFATTSVSSDTPYTTYDSEYYLHDLVGPGIKDTVLFLSVIDGDKKNEMLTGIKEKNPSFAAEIEQFLKDNDDIISVTKFRELHDTDRDEILTRLMHAFSLIEPSADIHVHCKEFTNQFITLLSKRDQEHLLRGFDILTTFIFNRWKRELLFQVSEPFILENKIHNNEKLQNQFKIMGKLLHEIATSELSLLQ